MAGISGSFISVTKIQEFYNRENRELKSEVKLFKSLFKRLEDMVAFVKSNHYNPLKRESLIIQYKNRGRGLFSSCCNLAARGVNQLVNWLPTEQENFEKFLSDLTCHFNKAQSSSTMFLDTFRLLANNVSEQIPALSYTNICPDFFANAESLKNTKKTIQFILLDLTIQQIVKEKLSKKDLTPLRRIEPQINCALHALSLFQSRMMQKPLANSKSSFQNVLAYAIDGANSFSGNHRQELLNPLVKLIRKIPDAPFSNSATSFRRKCETRIKQVEKKLTEEFTQLHNNFFSEVTTIQKNAFHEAIDQVEKEQNLDPELVDDLRQEIDDAQFSQEDFFNLLEQLSEEKSFFQKINNYITDCVDLPKEMAQFFRAGNRASDAAGMAFDTMKKTLSQTELRLRSVFHDMGESTAVFNNALQLLLLPVSNIVQMLRALQHLEMAEFVSRLAIALLPFALLSAVIFYYGASLIPLMVGIALSIIVSFILSHLCNKRWEV